MAGRGTDIQLGGNADMMAKDPAERTGSLQEVIDNLLPWAEQTEAEAAAAAKPGSGR